LVQHLLEGDADVQIRAFSRTPFPGDGDGRVDSVLGDITELGDVESAVAGCDEIYHLAGVVDRSPTDNWRLYRTHVDGTRNVCEALIKHGPRRCVIATTSGTIAVSREPVVHTEESGYKQAVVHQWPYYLSKIYQEKQALWYCQHRKLPLVIVNPSLLLGPGDDRRSSTNDVRLFLMGQIKAVPTGGLNLIDARDAAAAVANAMRSGSVGERYLLGGENLTFKEWIAQTAHVAGVSGPRLQPGEGVARFGAAALRRLYPLVGKSFELDDASVRMSSLFWYCDAAKARRELGLETRPTEATLRDTIAYLRSSGSA
jgi:dihydroflavonol-4-reductase